MYGVTLTTSWLQYRFTGLLPHCVPIELERKLRIDLAARYPRESKIVDSCPTHTWTVAPTGVDLHRPVETLELLGLELSMPSEDVYYVTRLLRQITVRTFVDDIKYCKLKTENQCLVMTPIQTVWLYNALRSRARAARRRVSAYYATLGEARARERIDSQDD